MRERDKFMRIYFTASITAMDQYRVHYEKIIQYLKKEGYDVQADHILKAELEVREHQDDEQKVKYYSNFLKNVGIADIVVAEASYPSTVHIGHEISIALGKGKPVIVLYLKGKEPIFLKGITDDRLLMAEYTLETLGREFKYVLEEAKEGMDVRFNFFVSPKIVGYLDWIAKKRKMPRAVYLRRLIEEDMKKNKDFAEE